MSMWNAPSRQTVSRRWAAVALLANCAARYVPARGAIARSVTLDVASDGDLLAFRPDSLTCSSGARVHLVFHHAGKYITQDHNWVLVKPGTAAAVAAAGLKAGEVQGWVEPGDSNVLAATRPCGKGEHASVDFIAPPPGDYPFLCTNPGHGAVMHGVLHVTAPRSTVNT